MNCRICKSKNSRKIFVFYETSPDKRIKYSLIKCKFCGFIRPYPLPYTEKTKKEVYNKSDKKIKIDFQSLEAKHYQKNFQNYLEYIKKYNIKGIHLDVGCGNGSLLYLSQQVGLKSEGIELNRSLVKQLKRKGFIVYNQELESKIIKTKKYDLITANHVIEHIEDLSFFIKNVYNLLNDKGYFIISSPYIYGLIPKILRTKWYGQGYGCHLNFFSIKSIKLLLKTHKFKVIEIKIASMDYTKFNMPYLIKKTISLICGLLAKLKLGDNLFVVAKKVS